MNILVYLVFYPFVLVMIWGPHNMWDRLLIKCDLLLTLESKKQISLWHIYIYTVCPKVRLLDGEAPSGMYRNRSKSHPEMDRSSGHCRLEVAWPVCEVLVVVSVFQWGTHLTRQLGTNSHWLVSSLPGSLKKKKKKTPLERCWYSSALTDG